MNRAERRRQVKDKGKKEAVVIAQEFYTVALAYYLHTELGYGHKRLLKTLGDIESIFQDINEGKASFEGYRKVIRDNCNIDLK